MTGKAYLVGAGPGRADLISVRGLTLLRAADVVIYDRLIAQELLHEIRSQAERIFVGKQGHQGNMMPQAEINALLVSRVQAGRQVVRLKGGGRLRLRSRRGRMPGAGGGRTALRSRARRQRRHRRARVCRHSRHPPRSGK